MKTYNIFLDNEEGDQFFYEGPSSWDSKDKAFVFDSFDEAKGVIKQLARVDYPWNCDLHIIDAKSGLGYFSLLAEGNYRDRNND